MKNIETLTRFIMLASIFPIMGLLAGWFIFFNILPDARILLPAMSGFFMGVLIDVKFLKQWMEEANQASLWIWALVYLFYTICIFGFFMGVPLANLALGLPAGILFASRLRAAQTPTDEVPASARKFAWFTTLVYFIICIASATIALLDPYTAANLEGMLQLPFQLTLGMIWGLIIIGGTFTVAVQWLLTHTVVQRTYQWLDA
jgi:hypothetical protein